ncbi:hypothetical protein GE061_015079 [Apolygus lucorum]|uniref:DUF7869 domain-containing protein n=1 Tax=Apolygus lucorum TaxID=248454 RepID=A0A8S9XK04_APOLU|nr:hypothetical protein GE061_015079 [Apolygus lucorum]
MIKKKKVVVWSDNCGGQMKNRMILALYCLLIAHGHYTVIDHKFLVSGHSFLPCDRDFGIIEKRKMKSFVPEDLHEVIRSANTVNPFKVIDMDGGPFFDFGKLASNCLNTTKLKISTSAWLRITEESLKDGSVLMKTNFASSLNWTTVKVFKSSVTIEHFKDQTLTALGRVNHVTAEKKKDLLSMVPYLKEEKHKEFHQKLLV